MSDLIAEAVVTGPLRRPSALCIWLLLSLIVRASASRGAVPPRGSPQAPLPTAEPAASAAKANATAASGVRPAAPREDAEAASPATSSGGEATASPTTPVHSDSWENSFAWGLYYSKLAVDGPEPSTFDWTYDAVGSAATVPVHMLKAEVLLAEGADGAILVAMVKEKKAEQALRMYYHAKWLAERNYERAAEWRYREASRIAREAKRSVLAAHSLSRLGYFFMHWARFDEAREVLLESERTNTKSNPLGPFLYGVLERRTAGSDRERLLAAEERILAAGQQPSEELEVQRAELTRQILFWRSAESSPARCADGHDAIEVVICVWTHAVSRLVSALQR